MNLVFKRLKGFRTLSGLYVLLLVLMGVNSSSAQQVVVDQQSFNGSALPSGWTGNDVIVSGGYARLAGSGASVTSPQYNLSLYNAVSLSFEFANETLENGGAITVSISSDGGTTYTAQTFTTPQATGVLFTSFINQVTAFTNEVKVNFSKQGGNGPLKLRQFKLEGTYQPTLLLNGTATENTLNGAKFVAELTVGNYKQTLDKSFFALTNAPSGVSIASVVRNSNTQATITFGYNNTDFDINQNIGLSIDASQIVQGIGVTSTNTIPVAAHVETITITPPVRNGLNYYEGYGPSPSKSFTIAATNLAPGSGTITITGNTYYAVSLSPNSNFGQTATINYNEGTLSTGAFYVRLKSALPVGEYNAYPISLTGGKAAMQVVANGKVIGTATTNDLCSLAETLESFYGNVRGTLAGATYTAMTQGDNAKDVWYKFVAPCQGNYSVTLSGYNGNADLFLFNASCPTALTQAIASSQTGNTTENIEYSLTAPGTYYIRVAAMNAAAEGTNFEIDFHKNEEVPSNLSAGTITNITNTTATISGTPQIICGTTLYGIEYSTIQGFTPGTGILVPVSNPVVSGVYSHQLTGLTEDTTYYFRLYELNTMGTGYGQEQSFATAQPLLGTEAVIIPATQQSANATNTSFRTRWFMPGQYGVKLHLSTSPSFDDVLLLSENFAGFAGNGAIPVNSPDAHFAQAGYTVSNVYEGEGIAVVGAQGQAGSVTTPATDLSAVTADAFLSFDVRKFGTDNAMVQVLFSANGQDNWVQIGSDFAVLAQSKTFVLPITGGTATSKFRIQSVATAPGKRFYLDNVQIKNYTGTSQTLTYAALASQTSAATVAGEQGLIYQRLLTSLTANTTYYVRLMAEYNGLYSAPSETITVATLEGNVQNGIIYVRKDQQGTGESWESPMSELADALYLAKHMNDMASGTIRQIWVASGKYRPLYRADNFSKENPDDRDNAFVLQDGVSVYGGFAGFESSINNRQYLPLTAGVDGGESMLTGKIGLEEVETDNVYHLIVASGITAGSNTVVDGFVIRDSYTDGTGEITVNGHSIKRYNGGGIYNKNSEYELRNSLVEMNYVTGNGAGVYNENCGAGMVINTMQISSNTATSGAGVANVYGAPVIKGTTIRLNTATANGGGVYNESTAATITDLSYISLNDAVSGGGVYNIFSTTKLNNVSLVSNTADYGAGSYSAVSNSTSYDRVRVKENNAQIAGGGFYIEGDQSATASGADSFVNNLVTGNTAVNRGGAIYYSNGNDAQFSGISAGPIFTNSTFSGNTAASVASFLYYNNAGAALAPPVFRNSIIINPQGTFTEAADATGASAAVFKYTLTNLSSLGANFNSGNNILASDPLFVNPLLDDYTLDTDSPAVNNGLNDYYDAGLVPNLFAVTRDYAGNERIFDGYVDLGAYEWQDVTPCTITTTWNGTTWSDGEPGSIEYAAVFNGDYTSTGSLTACSVTVNSGNIVVNAGHSLKVKGAVNVGAGATLTVENNGALVQINNQVNTGNIVFKKNSNQLYRYDYTMWSSPVADQNILFFSPLTASDRYFEYKYDYNGSNWIEAYFRVNGQTTAFAPGKSYLIRMPNLLNDVPGYNTLTTAVEFEGKFTGVPNNGNINVNLSTLGNLFTAIGNPYPSPISVSDFFAANSSVLDQAAGIYMWRKKNNSDATSYAVLTLAGFVANPAIGGGANQAQFFTGTSNSWVLAPGQGFIVKTKTGVTTPVLKFNNRMRRATPGATQGFLKEAQPKDISRVWINIAGDNDLAAQTAIAYMQEGTLDYDYGYDGSSLTNSTINLYTLGGDKNFAIQARPVFEASDVVPLGYSAGAEGAYTISIDRSEGVFANGQAIFLRDNLLGTVTEISAHNYVFTTAQGTFNDRFDVLYKNTALNINVPAISANDVTLYKNAGNLTADAGSNVIEAITVYDIHGRRMFVANAIEKTSYAITGLQVANQVLIVEIATAQGKVTKKVIY